MNKLSLRLLAFIIVLAPTSVAAQTLWRNVSVGMTPQQVLSRISGAIVPNDPSNLANGAVENVRLPKITIIDKPFRVQFYFLQRKLQQVTLNLIAEYNFESAALVFDNLKDALSSKYGNPISNRSHRGLVNEKQANWLNGQVNINLYLLAIGRTPAVLNVNYQTRIGKERKNL